MNLENKRVMIELKRNGFKYFGLVEEYDTTPENFNWIILRDDKTGKYQIINDSEIARMEVLE